MSKTFNSDNELAKTISITRSQGRVLVEIEDPKHLIAINLSDNNAHALTLAILEAAGVVPENRVFREGSDEHLQCIAYDLTRYLERSAERAVEVMELAELEAEALGLYKAHTGYTHAKSLSETAFPERWLSVARKAREMRKP